MMVPGAGLESGSASPASQSSSADFMGIKLQFPLPSLSSMLVAETDV